MPRSSLLVAFIGCALVACGESARQASGADASLNPEGTVPVDTTPPPAPRDTVDSLAAARLATVMDTIGRPASPAAPARPAVAPDSTRPRGGLLGPNAGERHMSFRGNSAIDSLWPVKGPAPLPGSILPAQRIIAYYGNPLSTGMGILGQIPPDSMLAALDDEVAAWTRLDPATPAKPALHLIVLVANGFPGSHGRYRTRHDSAMIEKVYGWARSRNALLFLDLQVGQSTLEYELPWIEKFLVRPDVHLGIDPEFSMKRGGIPGKRVGTYDAADINYATRFLANLVDKHRLPPKILVVHRFTQGGVTNAHRIELDPRVQFVMHMDGFGPPWSKRDTYYRDIKREPVQFAGWKQFTKRRNDWPPTPRSEILRLWPVPLYIQVQ